jgi:HK97 family phage portal protein
MANIFKRFINRKGSSTLGSLSTSWRWFSYSLFGPALYNRSMKHYVEQGFGKNPFVFMVINKISEVISRMDYEIKDRNGNPTENSPLNRILISPNTNQPYDEFIYNIAVQLLSSGNAFIYGVKPVGFDNISELKVLSSKDTEIKVNRSYEVTGYWVTENGRTIKYEAEEVLHIKFPNIVKSGVDSLYGFSPLESAIMVYESSNNVFEAEASIFRNRGAVGILSNQDTEQPMLDDEQERVQSDWQEKTSGSHRFGKIIVTNSKVKYEQLAMSPNDLKLIEQSISKLRIICSIYGVDSSLFNDPENKTYNNRSEAQKAFYTDAVIPLANKIIKALNNWIGSDDKISLDTSKVEALRTINKDLSEKVINEYEAGLIDLQTAQNLLGYGN